MDAVNVDRGDVIGVPRGQILHGGRDTAAKGSPDLIWDETTRTLKITGSITLLDSIGNVMATFTDDNTIWGMEQAWAREAAQAMGVPVDQMIFKFIPVAATGEVGLTVNGAGTRTPVDRAVQLSVNANFVQYVPDVVNAAGFQPRCIATSATGKWWLKWRGKYTVATPPDTGGGMQAHDGGTLHLVVGAHATAHATNFSLFGAAGVSINSGIAMDTNTHDFSGWRDGSNSFLQIDTAKVPGTARPSADAGVMFCINHAAAAARGLEVEVFAYAFPRR
jgi:hypothetical protein